MTISLNTRTDLTIRPEQGESGELRLHLSAGDDTALMKMQNDTEHYIYDLTLNRDELVALRDGLNIVIAAIEARTINTLG